VPPVAGRDEDGIDVVAGEQFAEVAVQHAVGVAVFLVHHLLARSAASGLHVRNRDALHVRQRHHRIEDVAAAIADADDAERDSLAGGGSAALEAKCASGDDRGQGGCSQGERLPQKRPPRW